MVNAPVSLDVNLLIILDNLIIQRNILHTMKRVDSIADIRKTIGLHRVTLNNQYHIRRIGIFGSAARDELSDSSDVDILVEFETTVGYFLLSHLHDELCKILGRNVDLATPGAIHPVLHDSIMQDLIYV